MISVAIAPFFLAIITSQLLIVLLQSFLSYLKELPCIPFHNELDLHFIQVDLLRLLLSFTRKGILIYSIFPNHSRITGVAKKQGMALMKTDRVSIRILQMVSQHMSMQIGFLVKPLMTVLKTARERFFSSMYPQMSFQVKVKREFLSTKFALIWFFTLKNDKKGGKLTVCTNMCLFSLALSRNFLPQPSFGH